MLRRRAFLKSLTAGAGLVLGVTEIADAAPVPAATDAGSDPLWEIIASVQAHLLPVEAGAPGAAQINAIGYLRAALDAPDADPQEKKFLLAGAGWLQKTWVRDHAGGSFDTLTVSGREALLRRMERGSEAGRNWLALLLYYLLEALLTDPVYGGNTREAGWTWLDYIPGFPRPPADKRYFELLKR